MNNKQLAFILIILVATGLRLHQLTNAPPGLWFDEAYNAMETLQLQHTGQFEAFFIGNNGREAGLFYLLAGAMTLFGPSVYTLRLTVAFASLLSIPLMYVLTARLFPNSGWLALTAAAGLATSLWYLGVSRVGLRVALLMPVFLACLYWFWCGWQARRYDYLVLAGLALGLCQYTYLAARIYPLLFCLFIGWHVLLYPRDIRFAGAGLAMMAGAAMLVFAPLGVFFWQNPEAFINRAENVMPAVTTFGEGIAHLGRGLGMFVQSAAISTRYYPADAPLLDIIGTVGLWAGLLLLGWRYQRPVVRLMLLGLLVTWLPGLLSEDSLHEMRQVGMLPFIYTAMAFGWTTIATRVGGARLTAILPLGLLLLSGSLTATRYFAWAQTPTAYQANQGAILDTAYRAQTLADSQVVLLPFETYAYPSARYVLAAFTEVPLNGPQLIDHLSQMGQAIYLGDTRSPHGLVWLAGGRAYISSPLPDLPLTTTTSHFDPLDQPLDVPRLQSLLAQAGPASESNLRFDTLMRLEGYHVTPRLVQPGGFSALDLYWRGLNTAELDGDLVVEVHGPDGRAVTQFREAPFSSAVSRWHWNALIPGRHLIWLGAEATPGPYVIQLGLVAPSGRRYAIWSEAGPQPLVGLTVLYVQRNPHQPATPLMQSGDIVQVTGFTLHRTTPHLAVDLHVHLRETSSTAYEFGLAILNEAGQTVAEHFNPPFEGLYPTTHWPPGESMIVPLRLDWPADLPSGRYQVQGRVYQAGQIFITFDIRSVDYP